MTYLGCLGYPLPYFVLCCFFLAFACGNF